MKVVIIGGVAGGATAAARLRRLNEEAEIVVLERSGFVSYANCGLPYYVGGVIEDEEELTLQTPQSFFERFHIDVRVHSEALSIDRAAKTVRVRELLSGREYEESYDKLLLAPGAAAMKPALPGVDGARVLTLRTVEDTLRLRDLVVEQNVRRAVVVGGGFIGLEAAENLLHRGVATTLLQRSKQVLPPLDGDMAALLHGYLRRHGLDLRFGQNVQEYEETQTGVRVLLKEGEPVEGDLVLLAIGVVPENKLAKDAGLALGVKGAIVTDEHMRTADPDIYAVGDAVQVKNFVTGADANIALAGPANKQGRIAADNICGIPSVYTGAQGSSVIKLFDMTAASTGLNEKAAKAAGIPYGRALTYSASHASYYPGARNMTVKTLFDPATGKILGAQIVGFEGVDKRIDVLATAIRAGMTAEDLTELDLAYAPPYSSAKDPVNMAGYVIENLRAGLVRQVWWDELEAQQDALFLDVRTPEEFARGRLEGAVNIPLDELRGRLQELEPARGKEIVVNCHSGLRSYLACRILAQHGFSCKNLAGGFQFVSCVAEDACYGENALPPCGLRVEKG